MQNTLSIVLTSLTLFASMHVHAVAPPSQSALNKKQLIGCMNKQMTASRTMSYNEATRVCKFLIKAQNDRYVASNAAKPPIAR